MSSTETGREAENQVAEYLRSQKFKILDQNWRNRYCEIDIVASKKKSLYFVEVKYRSSAEWGGGVAAISPDKLRRMSNAAEAWVQQANWHYEYELIVAVVDDEQIELIPIYGDNL